MSLDIALYHALRSAQVADERALEVVKELEKEMDRRAEHVATKTDLLQTEHRLTLRMGGIALAVITIQSLVMTLLKVFG